MPSHYEDDSIFDDVFSSVGNYFNRATWAGREALLGDFDKAGAQIGSLFGGKDPGKGMPGHEFIYRTTGYRTKEDSWERTISNFALDMGTDPHTFLTLGVGGLAKGVLVGATKKISTRSLATALNAGYRGKKSKDFLDAIRTTGSSEKAAEKIFHDIIPNTKFYKNLDMAQKARFNRLIDAEDWQNIQKAAWDDVMDALYKSKKIDQPGFSVRFAGVELPGSRMLGKTVKAVYDKATYPEMLRKGIIGSLLDKTVTSAHGVPEGLKWVARDYMQKRKAIDTTISEKIWKRFGLEGDLPWRNDSLAANQAYMAQVGAKNMHEFRDIINRTAHYRDPRVAAMSPDAATRIKQELLRKAGVEYRIRKGRKKWSEAQYLKEADMSLPEIIYSRKISKNRDYWRQRFKQDIDKLRINPTGTGPGNRLADALDKNYSKVAIEKYITRVFEDLNVGKRSTIRKVLSGGKIYVGPAKLFGRKRMYKGASKSAPLPIRMLVKTLFPGSSFRVTKEGTFLDFPGYTNLWKQMVTSYPLNFPFHLRNFVGSIFMGALDPDIGWSGIKAGLELGGVAGNGHLWLINKSLHADQKKAAKFMKEIDTLGAQGAKIGDMDIREFRQLAKRALGGRISHTAGDISSGVGDMFDLLNRHERKLGVNPLGKGWLNLGENLGNYIENQMRLNALRSYVMKGVSPHEAIFRMQKQFVDYSVQSNLENFLRDFVPFIKFQMGSLAWAKQLAERPRHVSWLTHLQEGGGMVDAKDPAQGEKDFVSPLGILGMPEHRVSFGAPAEATLGALSKMTNVKDVISDSHPVYKLFLEYGFSKDIWTGMSTRASSKAPWWMENSPKLMSFLGSKKLASKKRISWLSKELLKLIPLERQSRFLGLMYQGVQGEDSDKILEAMTSIKKVDLEKKAFNVTSRKFNKLLERKQREGELKQFTSWVAITDNHKADPDIRKLLKEHKEFLKKAGKYYRKNTR